MAGTTVLGLNTASTEEATAKLRLEFNKAVDDLDALQAKVNAIITAADTDLAAVAAVTPAVAVVAAKVADQFGNTTK